MVPLEKVPEMEFDVVIPKHILDKMKAEADSM